MPIEAIIFDLGGTLLEYAGKYSGWPELEAPGFAAAHEYLGDRGLSLPNQSRFQAAGFDLLPGRWRMATRGIRNLTVPSLLADVLDLFNVELMDGEILEEAAQRYQKAVCAGVRPIPHSLEIVSLLSKEGYKLGLVSNTMFSGRSHIADLQRFQLDTYFDSMVFSADINMWKPSPQPFLRVLDTLNVDPSLSVFIGDDPAADIVGGQRAGMHTIHFPSSRRFSSADGLQPDATITDLTELPGILAQLKAV